MKFRLNGVVHDDSGLGNNGLAHGALWTVDGHHGGGFQFGLTNDYITVPNKAELNPKHLTLSVWIKTSYSDWVYRRIFDKGFDEGYDLTMGGVYNGHSTVGQVVFQPGNTSVESGAQVTNGTWHHVAGTFDGAITRIYVDGKPAGTPGFWTGELAYTPYDLTIGGNRANRSREVFGASFNGVLDDVMMFNRALSAEEIRQLYDSQK
jgi:hypothetical protein